MNIRFIRCHLCHSALDSLQHYFLCEIHKLSLQDLRRFKLTHFPIIVKKKGTSRGYFIFEIADLRLNRDLEIISQPHRPAPKVGP